MIATMKLKDVCAKYGISRRAIQGYENVGLVKPYCKDKLGHLIYDTSSINRIIFIKFCQDIGYSLKEIDSLFKLEQSSLASAFRNKSEQLKLEYDQLNNLIIKTELIAEMLGDNKKEDIDICQIILRSDIDHHQFKNGS